MASRTSPARLCTPNFFIRLVRCVSTVRGEMKSCSPISLLDRPSAKAFRTSASRGLSDSKGPAAVARTTGAPLTPVPGLRERSFGSFQGRTFQQIETESPEQALRWRKRDPHFVPDGGGESLDMLRERIAVTVDGIAARHAGEQIVLVAHGGVMDVLYRLATRLDLQAPRTWQLTNAAINRLLWTEGNGLTLVGWADTQHLENASRDEIHS